MLSLLLLCVPTSGDVLLDAVMLVYMYIQVYMPIVVCQCVWGGVIVFCCCHNGGIVLYSVSTVVLLYW